MATSRISPYSLPALLLRRCARWTSTLTSRRRPPTDLKNTTDDALPNYLTSIKFSQSHRLTDVRLALGYSAVIIAAVTFVADYKLGWEQTKDLTAVAVVLYFALNAAFTYWIWGVEKGVVFVGERGGKKLTLSSHTKKNSPFYLLTVTVSSSTSPGSNPQETQIKAPFALWFTEDGYFVPKPFQQWLASSVPLIGEADPKNAVAQPVDQQTAADGQQALSAEDVMAYVSGTQAGQGKGKGKAKKRG